MAAQILRASAPEDVTMQMRLLIECLEKFKYRNSVVVNHTDEAPLPDSKSDWRELNLVTSPSYDNEQAALEENDMHDFYTMTTHILDSQLGVNKLMQTTNPIIALDPSKILSISELPRAVLSVDGKKAVERLCKGSKSRWDVTGRAQTSLGEYQGVHLGGSRIWICGSYASDGIPLLEGCLKSARTVVEQGILPIEGSRFINAPW